MTHLIVLGCPCEGAPGWSEYVSGETPDVAAQAAVDAASTCLRCGYVVAEAVEGRRTYSRHETR